MNNLKLTLTKRQKIVIASTLITIGLFMTQLVNIFFLRYRLVIGLAVLASILTIWALWEGITKLKAVVLLILPVFFTVGVASFYFLLPFRWLTRLPVVVLFGVSLYSLLLSQNVFNVASVRTIPLYRAASTVNFLFTLITSFFIYNVVYAMHTSFYLNGILIILISFPLILQVLWSLEMDNLTPQVLIYSGILAAVIGEVAIALSFWPIAPTMWSLSLATCMYVLVGIVTELFRDRLSRRVVWEYIAIGGVVFLVNFLTTSWVG